MTAPRLELPVVPNNENPALCRKCGGDCCKEMPGSYHPAQFGPALEGVAELLRAGKASIDWWEGDSVDARGADGKKTYVPIPHKGYYLRPAIKPGRRKGPPLFSFFAGPDGDGGVFDPSFGGECVNLTPAGCSLAFADRPLNCQALAPDPDRDPARGRFCDGEDLAHNKPGLVIAWNPLSPLLEKIGRQVEGELDRAGRS